MTSGNFAETASKFGGRTILMVLKRLLTALKTRWWIPLVTGSLATVAAAFYVAQMPPPMYVSTARMWVAGKIKLPEGASYVDEANLFYGTQAELMQSKTIGQRAHARVQAEHPDQKPIAVRVGVTKAPQASIFILSAMGADDTYPRLFLEALMTEFLMFKREAKSDATEGTTAQVSQQKFKSDEELKAAQQKFDEFQADKPLAVMEEEALAARQNFARWNRELTERKVELQTIDQMLALGEMPDERTAKVGVRGGDDPSADTRSALNLNEPRDQDYKSVKARIAQEKIRREDLGKYLKPAHPKMVEIDRSILAMEKLLGIYEGQSREEMLKAREGFVQKIKQLETQLAEAKGEVERTAKVTAEAARLKKAIDLAQRQVDSFNQILTSVDITQGMDQDTLQVLEHASAPGAAPLQKTTPVLGGAAGGVVVGLVIVLLLVWFDDRLGSLSELRANVDCLVVGQVPEIELKKGENRLELLEPDDDRHHFAESYRNIRSSLLFMATDGVRPKTILITSSVPAEGKSTVTSNLARAMAFTGSKVLLIEGDQRRGVLHELFKLPSEPGLAEVLRGEKEISEVLRATTLPNLTFISRGRPPRNPGELFLGTSMDRLLQDVYNQYDYILIDSAPVLAADDTTSLAPKMDGVLFVVRNSYTSAKMLRQSMELLQQRQVRILGVVYNRANTRGGDYNYYHYPQYYISTPEAESGKKPKKVRKAKKEANGAVNGQEIHAEDVEPAELVVETAEVPASAKRVEVDPAEKA